MRELLKFTLIFTLTIALGFGIAFAGNGEKPPPGKHYNLNIIGFANCKKYDDSDPDCYKGNGDIGSQGHTIFVPLQTWLEIDPCSQTGSQLSTDEYDNLTTVSELKKGVRILVSDGGGAYDSIHVVDRDATDGSATFALPDGNYQIWARPLGKPGGCMDVDTLICGEADDTGIVTQYDCTHANLNTQTYVLVGHLDVDRTKDDKKPRWRNATGNLLPLETGIGVENGDPGYFDFFWQIFNNNLRLLQLRIYDVTPQ